jgi:hypothetical protein
MQSEKGVLHFHSDSVAIVAPVGAVEPAISFFCS